MRGLGISVMSAVIQGSFPGGQPRLPWAGSAAGLHSVRSPDGSSDSLPRVLAPHVAAAIALRRPPVSPSVRAVPAPRTASLQPRLAAAPKSNAFAVPPGLLDIGRCGLGSPLPGAVRMGLETLLGADFSDVRIHQGREAAALGALAFTQGSRIFFAPAQYNPTTVQGQRLLAHELTHVLQQRSGRVRNPSRCTRSS